MLKYFAYGSNMHTERFRERCPSASRLGIAMLHGYELKWHKRSKDGSGKCDIIKSTETDAVVHGVLYEIPSHEKPRLDRAEGLGYGYEQVEVDVLSNGQAVTAVAYVATNVDPALRPLDWYHAHVVDGAVEHGLPPDYITKLRAVQTVKSGDPQADKNPGAVDEAAF